MSDGSRWDERLEIPTLSVDIDKNELALHIVEGLTGVLRPAGMTAEEVLRAYTDDLAQQSLRAAQHALDYFTQCLAESRLSAPVTAPPTSSRLN